MAFNRPIPKSKQRGKAGGSLPSRQAEEENAGGSGTPPPQQTNGGLSVGSTLLGAWVQAEKMIQVGLMLPSAAFIGWLIGYGLDRWLHQTWIAMIGIVVGIFSGLIGAIRMAMVSMADPKGGGKNGDGTENGTSGKPS